jgi:ligand-binding sensor domain-containing protein
MDLFQDSEGYIWIGTKGGVSRYDGINFVNFSIDEGLPDSRVVDINEDKNGNIWELTSSGLSVFNG